MQELMEQFENRLSSLKEVQATAIKESKYLLETQIEELEVSILSAEAMLEKEKMVINCAYSDGVDNARVGYECKDYYNQWWNTKER